jgi:hypothetical protein
MLNYAETTRTSTVVSVGSVPAGQSQAHASVSPPLTSAVSSYALGLLDSAHLRTQHAALSDGEEIILLVPTDVPPVVLADSACKGGCEWGYDEEELLCDLSVPQLVNQLYYTLKYELHEESEFWVYAWIVGFLLGSLARLAESDRTLALVGVAHLRFLLSFLPLDAQQSWPRYGLYHAGLPHDRAVKAYRARVRTYRELGKSFEEAQRLALVG